MLSKTFYLLDAYPGQTFKGKVTLSGAFDDFLEAECADTGKPKSLASHIDIPRGAANFKIFADVIKNAPTEFFEMATPDGGLLATLASDRTVRRLHGFPGLRVTDP